MRAVFQDEYTIAMEITCRTDVAFAAGLREIEDGEVNRLGTLRIGSVRKSGRRLRVYLFLERAVDPDEIFLYYSDGRLHRLEAG